MLSPVLSPVLTLVLTPVLSPVLRTVLTPVLSFLSSDPLIVERKNGNVVAVMTEVILA